MERAPTGLLPHQEEAALRNFTNHSFKLIILAIPIPIAHTVGKFPMYRLSRVLPDIPYTTQDLPTQDLPVTVLLSVGRSGEAQAPRVPYGRHFLRLATQIAIVTLALSIRQFTNTLRNT